MDKRILIWSVLVITIGISYVAIQKVLPTMCGNEISAQIDSPDKKHVAIVFQRGCGATTSFNTQVTVLEEREVLENEAGNVLIAEGHPSNSGFELAWLNSSTLHIKNKNNAKQYKNEEKIGSVVVRYE